jgi:hypothetical protein
MRRRVIPLGGLAAILVIGGLSSAALASPAAAPRFGVMTAASGVTGVDDRRPVGGGVYDASVNTTFVSWSGSNVDNYVQAYNGTSWSKPVKVGAGDGDPHNYPTMVEANDGHLLVFRGLHNTQLMESRSANARSVSGTWNDHQVPEGQAATYPMPVKADNGDIFVFYRQTDNTLNSSAPVDERPMEYVRSTDNGATWTSSKTLTGQPYILGSTTRSDDMNEVYVGQIRHEENPERFSFVWTLAGGGPGNHQHDLFHKNLYYAYFTPSDRHFHNAAGTDLGPALTNGDYPSCLVLDTGAPVDKNPGYFSLAGTFGDGTPVVVYTLADGNHAAHWTGSSWHNVKLGGDHFLDMEPADATHFRVFANSGSTIVTYLLSETPSWTQETSFSAPGSVLHGVLIAGYRDPLRILLTGGDRGGVYVAGAH